MKKVMLLFVFILPIILIVHVSFIPFLSKKNSCQMIETKSCCEKNSNHCNKESKSGSDKKSCATICCASLVYVLQNQKIYFTINQINPTKTKIFSKSIHLTKGFSSDWFHPPNFV